MIDTDEFFYEAPDRYLRSRVGATILLTGRIFSTQLGVVRLGFLPTGRLGSQLGFPTATHRNELGFSSYWGAELSARWAIGPACFPAFQLLLTLYTRDLEIWLIVLVLCV